MELSITIKTSWIQKLKNSLSYFSIEWWLVMFAIVVAITATNWSYINGYMVAYGDSESHLNIAKRVIDSLSPGFAQLGGIWLPIPHLLLVPFVYSDFLWRTGLAGAIVSGVSFVISVLYLYRLTFLVTKSKEAGAVASLLMITNPNMLYMQSTPMTEVPLICFFLLSSYYFIRFLQDDTEMTSLLLAAIFGFASTLSRYDGWFLVAFEAGVLFLKYFPWRKIPRRIKDIKDNFEVQIWKQFEGKAVMFCTLAFFGIILWFAWDYLILGDPLYFTNSQFSAKTQQGEWDAKGLLPTKHNAPLSFLYYSVTSMSSIGVFVFFIALAGFIYYLVKEKDNKRFLIAIILLVPFIFNVLTLFLGQSVIFIPHVTPVSFEWRLFNVRYGLMMVPTAAFLVAFLYYRMKFAGKALIVILCVAQIGLYYIGYSKVITLEDGRVGLSSAMAKLPDAQYWMAREYDGGLVLVDDYARTLSIIRTKIPMKSIIYIGNRGYWDDSFKAPEKYAKWIIMQKNDSLWTKIYEDPKMQGRLYKYFNKAYTSPDILIFKRNPDKPIEPGDEIPSTIPGYELAHKKDNLAKH